MLRHALVPVVTPVGLPPGADAQGRDMITRPRHGLRVSLPMGFAAMALGGSFGAQPGFLAAFHHRRLDRPIMRLLDMLLSFPAIFGRGIFPALLALSVARQRLRGASAARAEGVRAHGICRVALHRGLDSRLTR
jgi:ABC-type dipeptide/oligopeptide/nickel transport system permease subunit